MADHAATMALKIEGENPIRLSGVIDETANLDFLQRLTAPATISLAGIRRINSHGVRVWVDAVRRTPPSVDLRFIECSPAVVEQVNMIAGFLGRHQIVSFYAPMECERCGEVRDFLFQVSAVRQTGGRLPPTRCQPCDAEMILDAVELQYLFFIRESISAAGTGSPAPAPLRWERHSDGSMNLGGFGQIVSLRGFAPFLAMVGGVSLGAFQTLEDARRAVESAARGAGIAIGAPSSGNPGG